ncbi:MULTISPECIES: Fe-S cluster assembly protein SufD [unclassified Leucobacter]|uniref:Fe-S cluster assembly protein SufD n=1 Tax=unclassified Leucobacter TaxID=2621730 RepID=UPI00165E04A2|nr:MULTISPECIES: Fe-S cluster assembly protein SufD [unclassified Leucobacter]MBC9926668.1 Fe-S cluster assembly protein SufD [Leucobacter sp. cx-169]MBC9935370.1 Fe-S cluster assembly protein SufD [Leucobacter sp. cx-87]
MTIVDTTAETAQHGLKAHSDGGWDRKVPVQTRSERFTSTDVADFPIVTGREANWKFSPIKKLDALLNGELDGSRTPVTVSEAEGISHEWIARDDARIGRAGTPEERGAAAAWSAFGEALLITVSGEEESTVVVTRDSLGTAARAAHLVIESTPFSRGLVILEHTGEALLSENVEIVLGDESKLTVVSVQQWGDAATHLSSHYATIGRNAELTHIVVSLGGETVRLNPSFHLDHEGAGIEALGAYFADAGQHLEQQVYVDHLSPHTRSRVTYKGALQGEGARTVWIGDVLIRRSAEGTDSYEQNRNLVLSPGTRADSIPNLEIETGDIEGAGHASATGRFDDEHLFYLMSRGISEEEARKLVVRGFLLEVINQIGHPATEARLQAAIEAELEEGVY